MKLFGYAFWSLLLISTCFAQGVNVNLIANLNEYPVVGYSDCWGYTAPDNREYALLGVSAGVSIVDVTDSSNIAEVDFIPFVNYSWYDIKTYQNYMYVTSEGTKSLLVVDLSSLPDSVSVVGEFPLFSSEPHNNFIDTETGILYGIEDFNLNPSVRIIDILSPGNPTEISTINTGNNGADAHDVFAQDSVLYIAEGNNPSIGIFDVSDPANPSLLQRLNIPAAGYVHQVWVTGDNHYMVTTEETVDRTVKLWDVQDINNISLVGEYLGDSRLAHNAYFKDDFVFLSHYESGLTIVDVSDPTDMVEVGKYDTYPQNETPNFNGAWGVYPFAQNGMIFISDIQTGLYVLRFDSVRASGIEGTVTDAQTSMPIQDVDVIFVEADKTIQTDQSGFYSLRTFEGNHTIIFSKSGYFSDTLNITLPSGPNIVRDVALDPNLADIDVSVDSLNMTLPTNTTATTDFIIRNVGPSGRLDYVVDDINGPILKLSRRPSGLNRTDWKNFKFENDLTEVSSFEHTNHADNPEGLIGDTIIVDPPGDLVFGSGGDAIGLYATVTSTNITFEIEFLNNIDTDSAFAVLALDSDFDPNTGAFPGGFGFNLPAQNVGSEFDVLFDVSGNIFGFPLTYVIFQGSNSPGGGQLVYQGSLSVNANIVSASLPLSFIGGDANMLVAGFTGHYDPGIGNVSSIDYLPDVGNGTVGVNPFGDLPWLSLSLSGGTLFAAESDTVTVTFDTNGLEESEVYTGVIIITSNDPDEATVAIPVTLLTEPVIGIDENPHIPEVFALDQNYPNPFNPTTRIDYQLPKSARVRLTIYNILGQEVRKLVDEAQTAGEKSALWDGRDNSGRQISSGVYIYRLEAADFTQTRKMVLIR